MGRILRVAGTVLLAVLLGACGQGADNRVDVMPDESSPSVDPAPPNWCEPQVEGDSSISILAESSIVRVDLRRVSPHRTLVIRQPNGRDRFVIYPAAEADSVLPLMSSTAFQAMDFLDMRVDTIQSPGIDGLVTVFANPGIYIILWGANLESDFEILPRDSVILAYCP
jgi:hypothetical protein